MLDQLPAELLQYKDLILSSAKDFMRIDIVPTDEPTMRISNVGGYPYLPLGFHYPSNTAGEKLNFLAQINFAELPPNNVYPSEGILQFYVGTDGLYGMDFDFKNTARNYQTIYHPTIDEECQADFYFLDELRKNVMSPFEGIEKPFLMHFEPKTEFVPARDYHFNELFKCFPYELFDQFNEKSEELYDFYLKRFDSSGHKFGGYAFFTQEDPRLFADPVKGFELLFQLDTGSGIVWGDMGIGGFFISKEDLAKRDFSRVVFNWDCH